MTWLAVPLAGGATALLVGACAAFSGTGGATPLALERTDLAMEGLIHGTLTIKGSCTWVVAGQDRNLLVWPADRTRWDAVTAEIVFDDRDRGQRRLRDGMEIALGGGAVNDTDGAAYTHVDWVIPPAAGCDTPTRYHVGSVVLP